MPARGVLVLRFVDGSRAGTELELLAGEHSLGRSSTCQVRFDVDADVLVSGRHLKIWFDDAAGGSGAWWALDLGSRNGTFINGIPTRERVRLHRDDEVVLGRDGTNGAVAFTILVEGPGGVGAVAPGEGPGLRGGLRAGSRAGSRDRAVTDPAFGLASAKPPAVVDGAVAGVAGSVTDPNPQARGLVECCWCGADASLVRAGASGRSCGVCKAEWRVASAAPGFVFDAAQRSSSRRLEPTVERGSALSRLLLRIGASLVRMSIGRRLPALATSLPKLFDATHAALAELGRAALDSGDIEVAALPEAAGAQESRRRRVAAGEHTDHALAALGAALVQRPKLGRKFEEFDRAAECLNVLRVRRAKALELRALDDTLRRE